MPKRILGSAEKMSCSSGPPASPIAWQPELDGYQTIIFPHEHGIFSADPSIRFGIGGYLAMTALPCSLRAVEPRARALHASGWRPRRAAGPSRNELADLVRTALQARPAAALR